MAAAGLAGLMAALVAYLHRGSGIDHTGGALLVIASTAILLAAALILALAAGAPGWLRWVLIAGCLLDALGTGLAAWFLHAWLLLALMVVAGLGWVLGAFGTRRRAGLAGARA